MNSDKKLVCRVYEERDLTDLITLMNQLGYEYSRQSLSYNIQQVRNQGGEVFIAEDAGLVCGCVAAILDIRLAEGIKGEIVSLVVNQQARGRGIGKLLVVAAEQWLSQYVDEYRIRANAIRKDAHQFYQQLGYSEMKQQVVLGKTCPKEG